MLDWLGRKLLYIALAIAALWYLLTRERKLERAESKADALQKVHDNVEKAKKAEQDIDRLTPDERRERLRNSRK